MDDRTIVYIWICVIGLPFGIAWLFLPFALYGIRRRLDLIISQLGGTPPGWAAKQGSAESEKAAAAAKELDAKLTEPRSTP